VLGQNRDLIQEVASVTDTHITNTYSLPPWVFSFKTAKIFSSPVISQQGLIQTWRLFSDEQN
jgi:hypothetical protein